MKLFVVSDSHFHRVFFALYLRWRASFVLLLFSCFCLTSQLGSTATPDLIIWPDALNPTIVERNFLTNTCEVIEGCAQSGLRRYLVFETETRNIGPADLVLGDPRFNTNFVFVSCHGHYHFSAFADYRLVSSAGVPVANGNKVGFCLRDSARFNASASPAPRYNCDFQGIQAGWADIYDASLPCQWVDLTGVAPGLYVLEIEVNPEGRLAETSRSNNIARMSLVIDASCSGPPSNDNFDSPIMMKRRVESAFSSTACATREPGERNHTGRNVTNTVWFRWIAPVSGNVVMTTEGSTFDTLLAVYRGTNHVNLTSVATGNNDGERWTSRLSFNASSNTAYQIVVAGLADAPGAVALHVNPGRNDAFSERAPLDGPAGSIAGLNTSATRESGEPNHAGTSGTNSVWFTWQSPTNGLVQFDTAGSNFDTLLALYTGDRLQNLVAVAADNDSGPARTSKLTFPAETGVTYQIAIDAVRHAPGFFRLQWGPPDPSRFLAITTEPGPGIQMNLQGTAGQIYDVQTSPDLASWTNWIRVTNLSGNLWIPDPFLESAGRRYYRAVTVTVP
jgi:Lysyl oxidase